MYDDNLFNPIFPININGWIRKHFWKQFQAECRHIRQDIPETDAKKKENKHNCRRYARYMSLRRTDYGATLDMFIGSTKDFQIQVEDPETSDAQDLSDTSIYATGNFLILKPDGTQIASVSITYTDRLNGLVSFTIDDTVTTSANAGNWIGKVQFVNEFGDIIDQQAMNFNILEYATI